MQEGMFWNIQMGCYFICLFNPSQYLLLLFVQGGHTKKNCFFHDVRVGDAS